MLWILYLSATNTLLVILRHSRKTMDLRSMFNPHDCGNEFDKTEWLDICNGVLADFEQYTSGAGRMHEEIKMTARANLQLV